MVKPLVLVASLANMFLFVRSTGQPSKSPCRPPQPVFCRANEIWSDCPTAVCAPKTCNDIGFPVACPDLRPDGKCPVKPGCICREGFVRIFAGVCIPMKYCPSCGGDPNAESSSGTNSNRLCSNYNKKPCDQDECQQSCFYNCCQCRSGFVYDEIKRKCVFPSQCARMTCTKKNEVYDPCPAPCPFRTCGINDAAISCIPALCPGDPECPPPKCRCKDGYYRDDVGECVLWEQCPVCDGLNEMYDPCPPPCPPQNCNVNIALILCMVPPKLGDPECRPGCRCIDDFVRNRTGVCIPRDQCQKCPNQNEVYDPCIAPCPKRRCDEDDRLIRCAAPPKFGDPSCIAGCRCADGFYRNSLGKCVTRAECLPKCKGPHEVYSECTQGDCRPKSCSQLGLPIPCPRIDPKFCKTGCLCEDGYVRDKNGVCILIEQCPPVCQKHEVYSDCVNKPCPVQDCSLINTTVVCVEIKPKDCIEGCICDSGYMRDDDGVCVPITMCNSRCNKPNEYYDPCDYNCPPNTCESLDRAYVCPIREGDVCKGRCKCKTGYFRNIIGECITEAQCRKCMGPHEYFSCGGACDNVCATLQEQNQTHCPIINIKCNEMCYCKKNYARAKNGTCIPIKDCNKPQCNINERYEKCPAWLCEPKKCSELGYPVPCPDVPAGGKCPVAPACVCIDGYVRNDKGKCIKKTDCPSCGGDPNAEAAYCASNCGRSCSDYFKENVVCTLECRLNGCICRNGYVYDSNTNQCVLPKYCTPICKKNEVYSECINGGCSAKNCSQVGLLIPCIKRDPKSCIKGCLCKEGYLREDNGECVPENDCKPKTCSGQNEVYDNCSNPSCVAKTCSEVGFPLNCTDPPTCIKECVCKEGYLRNCKGICIPMKQCPSCGGDPNAEAAYCASNCGRSCSDYFKENVVCTLECRLNGCICRNGYVYDSNTNQCVLPKDCTPSCKENEVYNSCNNGGCRYRNCSELNGPMLCIDPVECKGGCSCQKGYLRLDDTGVCVPEEKCPSKCNKPNEYYDPCDYNCPPNTCESLDMAYVCPIREGDVCKGRCKCKTGYFRNIIGECITEAQCRKCMGPHEYFSCGGACDNVCATLQEQNQTHCPIINIKCNEMCYCKKNYARAKNGTCIPIKDCNKPQCNINERYEKCPAWLCEPKKCSELGYPVPCPDVPAGGKCPVAPACVCIDGYVRNDKGKCIPKNDCPGYCSGQNEVYDNCSNPSCVAKKCSEVGFPLNCTDPPTCIKECVCKEGYLRDCKGICIPMKQCPSCGGDPNAEAAYCASNCGRSCSDYFKENVVCTLECRLNGCICRNGYVYDSNTNQCVLPKDCTEICDGKNEVYENCANPTCLPKKCSEVGFSLNCTNPPSCNRGCTCKEGYVRNSKGVCIPIKQCPSCGGDTNAEHGCGVNCLKKCYDLQNPDNPRPCPKICNVNSCDCKEGFYYDENTDTCVRSDECTPSCKENEVYNSCNNGGCRYRNCSELNGPMLCIDPIECKGGCSCKKGYLRLDDTGVCVPEEKCPTKCNKPNEYYDPCDYNCPPNTCESLDMAYVCPIREGDVCKGRCKCKAGYFRNIIGECITEAQCRKCMGPHEYFSCGGACDNVCATLQEQNQTHCPIINIKCNEMCYCKKKYARAKNGTCIPIKDCNKPQCNINERYEKCPAWLCEPKKCSELGYPVPCPDVPAGGKCPVAPACVCIDGYVRNDKGKCIPKTDCPSCGGDKNAEHGCGVNCLKKCYDLQNPDNPRPCPKICNVNSCDCKEGFYYDENTDTCVRSDECTPSCKENEVYNSCNNGGCRYRNCSELNGPMLCIDPVECKGGCSCKKGYLRLDDTGVCVPEEKCPKICDKPNEEFVKCPPICPPQVCSSINKTFHCPLIKVKINESDCVGECRCIEGYYRNLIGECICKEDCLKCPGAHEYFSCGPECDNVCCDLDKQSKDNCPIVNKKCTSKCYCEDGYARNDDGECVCIDECPGRGTTTPKPVVNSTVALENFERGNTMLAIKLLNLLIDSRPGENFMVSALSILIVLAQLALYAIGGALEQLLRVLNLKNKEEIRVAMPILIDSFKGQNDVIFEMANKIYAAIEFPLTEQFESDAKYIFDSSAENIDFNNGETAAKSINDWAASKTNDLIKDLVSADMFNSQTRVAFFNCLYFLGNWLYTFDPENTKPREFYLNDIETITLSTMFQRNTFEYGECEELDAQMLAVPYLGGQYKLFIYLPRQKTGLKSLVKNLTPDIFNKNIQSLKREKVDFSMPRMDFSTDISDLIDLLKKLNITAPFDTDSNQFTGIFKKDQSLYISDAIQKTVFKANENGTEAAASTGAILSTRSALSSTVYTFNANHPFIFFLKHINTIVFFGVFLR